MIISNQKFSQAEPFDNFYYQASNKEIILIKDNYLCLINGYLYPDLNLSWNDLFELLINNQKNIEDNKFLKNFKKFKGRYCGILINKKENELIAFNDQLGLNDIFYYFKNDQIIITDKFNQVFKVKEFTEKEIDQTALAEFFLFEHILLDRTFLKNVKNIPYATIKKFDLKINQSQEKQYWQFRFQKTQNFKRDIAIEHLDLLLKKSTNRIKKLHPKKRFAIGISGGMDSRLIAKYALDQNIKIAPFVFSNKNADAFYIAEKIAQNLKIKLKKLIIKDNFWQWHKIHRDFDPMNNLMYSAYISVRNQLPKAQKILTGFNGDNLFGSHIRAKELSSNNNTINLIKNRYLLTKNIFFSDKIQQEIDQDLAHYAKLTNVEFDWERCEIFNFENRQRRFIKNSSSFHFCLQKFLPDYSIFTDIDLVEYVLTFPIEELFECKLYFDFYKIKLPSLAKIRPERKAYKITDSNMQKKIKSTLLKIKFAVKNRFNINLPIFNNIHFAGALDWQQLSQKIPFDLCLKPIQFIDFSQVINLKNTFQNIRLKFHYLTIQLFINRFIKK